MKLEVYPYSNNELNGHQCIKKKRRQHPPGFPAQLYKSSGTTTSTCSGLGNQHSLEPVNIPQAILLSENKYDQN